MGGPFLFGAKVKKKSACGNARKAKLFGGAKNAKAFLCQKTKSVSKARKKKAREFKMGEGKKNPLSDALQEEEVTLRGKRSFPLDPIGGAIKNRGKSMSIKENISYFFYFLQRILGIEISRDNIYWENIAEIILIIFVGFLIIPIYFNIVDDMIKSYNVKGIDAFIIVSFKGSFLSSTAYLILLGLFSGIKNLFIKFWKVIFGGLLAGLVITIFMILLENILSSLPNINTFNTPILSIFSLYPIFIAILVRVQINQEIKN